MAAQELFAHARGGHQDGRLGEPARPARLVLVVRSLAVVEASRFTVISSWPLFMSTSLVTGLPISNMVSFMAYVHNFFEYAKDFKQSFDRPSKIGYSLSSCTLNANSLS
jgi:hypothetical protein